jgi:glutathione-regulated potassium-efflux system ancillary protein KefG
MNKILVVFAHPALERSRVHKILLEHTSNIEGVTFNDLYQNYPEFDIDVAAEQKRLLANDIIIWQHPFYWYSGPALLKQWMDLVLVHGWAYGKNGNALTGKKIFNAFTSGSGEEDYTHHGFQKYSVHEFLRPFERTAWLCNMIYWPPFWIHGTHKMERPEIIAYGRHFRQLLVALRDGKIEDANISNASILNELIPFNQTAL